MSVASPLLWPLSANPTGCIAAALLLWLGKQMPGSGRKVPQCVEEGLNPAGCTHKAPCCSGKAMGRRGGKAGVSVSAQGVEAASGAQPCFYTSLGTPSARVGSHLCPGRGNSVLSRKSRECAAWPKQCLQAPWLPGFSVPFNMQTIHYPKINAAYMLPPYCSC